MKQTILIFGIIILSVSIGYAQETGVPVKIQTQIIERIATFDRNFENHVNGDINIALIYQSKYRQSLNIKKQFEESYNRSNMFELFNLPLTVIPVDLSDTTDLKWFLKSNDIDIAYVAPLRAKDINEIAIDCRALKIRTFTGVPSFVRAGLAIGFVLRGNSPQIIVNIKAARLEGSDYSSRLLDLARIVDD